MTKEVKRKINDSLQGDSSLFNMDFTSEGFSWVKGLCQKLETSCNAYVDTCNKYVNTAGEHLIKIYDEVCEWENQYPTDKPVSDLCLKNDSFTETISESSVELRGICCNKKLFGYSQMQLTDSISEDPGPIEVCSKDEVASQEGACAGEKEESLSRDAVNCLDNTEENCKASVDSAIVHADTTGSSSGQFVPLIELDNVENGLTISEFLPSEKVEGNGRDDSKFSTSDVTIQDMKTEEFEAIKFEDFCGGVEKNDITLASRHSAKNKSFKRRLRNVFTTRKDYPIQNKDSSSAFSLPSKEPYPEISGQDSIESGWELL